MGKIPTYWYKVYDGDRLTENRAVVVSYPVRINPYDGWGNPDVAAVGHKAEKAVTRRLKQEGFADSHAHFEFDRHRGIHIQLTDTKSAGAQRKRRVPKPYQALEQHTAKGAKWRADWQADQPLRGPHRCPTCNTPYEKLPRNHRCYECRAILEPERLSPKTLQRMTRS